MYQCYDRTNDEIKKSTKGVPHRNEFTMALWTSVLLEEDLPRQTVEIMNLRRNNQKEIVRMKMEKTSLSDIFIKLQVRIFYVLFIHETHP